MTPPVTVLMPVYRPDPGYLRAAVVSVLAQTFPDFEFVIVEDPSPLSAADVLAEFPDPRIRHIRNDTRTSLVDQLNRGLSEARGELVARMDADDVCAPDRLARQVEFLRRNPDVAVVGSQLHLIDEAGRDLGFREYPCSPEAVARSLRRFNPLAHPSTMYRAAAVRAVNGYQYRRYPALEDYDLWCRLVVAGYRLANLAEPLLSYRIHRGGMKATKLRGILRGTLEVKRMHWGRQMTTGDWVRYAGEAALLALPPAAVLELFLWVNSRRRLGPVV